MIRMPALRWSNLSMLAGETRGWHFHLKSYVQFRMMNWVVFIDRARRVSMPSYSRYRRASGHYLRITARDGPTSSLSV